MPSYISKCFWTYPDLTAVAAGQVLEFSVVVPPPLTAATGAVVFPVSESSVSWSLQDTASPPNELVPGVHYHIVAGGLSAARLAVVFKPPAGDMQVKVLPKLSLFYAGVSTPEAPIPEVSDFEAQPFTLEPVTAEAVKLAAAQLAKALSLTAETATIEPGEPAVLRVALKNVLDIPQVVTSVLHETPEVKIRGEIPLDNIVQAFLSPVTSVVGQFVPGSKSIMNKAGRKVQSLLGGLFTVPLAVDVLGDKLTKTLAPVGAPQIPLLSASPDAQSLSGVVPIGSWPATFSTTGVSWAVEENGEPSVYNDLSQGENLVKSFLLRPAIVPLSLGPGAKVPTTITVTATLRIKIDTDPASSIEIRLPGVTLKRMPLPLPQIAAIFWHALDDYGRESEQRVFLTCDSQAAPFLASADDCLNLITGVASTLNKIIAVAITLSQDWADFINLATAFSLLADRVRRISPDGTKPGYVYFEPCRRGDPGPCINLSKTPWNNAASAVIAIGHPSTNEFVLSDADGDAWIAFGGTSSYSSILPSLDGTFKDLQQIPPDSARSNKPADNLNNILEVLGYGGVASGMPESTSPSDRRSRRGDAPPPD